MFRSLVLDLVGPSFEQVTAIYEVFRSLALVLCFSPLFLLDSFSFSIFFLVLNLVCVCAKYTVVDAVVRTNLVLKLLIW